MSYRMLSVSLLLLCTACAQAQQTGERGRDYARKEYVVTGQKLKEFFTIPARKAPEVKPASNSYCYKAQLDIVCYKVPIHGADERLVGYQEPYEAGKAPEGGASMQQGIVVDQTYMDAPPQPVSVRDTAPYAAPAGAAPMVSSPTKNGAPAETGPRPLMDKL